jgi:hypothetical protein
MVSVQTTCEQPAPCVCSLLPTLTLCRNEGVCGLYRGLSSPLCGVAMENGVSFLVFSRVMDYFTPEVAPHSGSVEPETPLHAVPSEW